MKDTELQRLDQLIQDLNSKYLTEYTLTKFIQNTNKLNLTTDCTFNQVKYEIEYMSDRLKSKIMSF